MFCWNVENKFTCPSTKNLKLFLLFSKQWIGTNTSQNISYSNFVNKKK